MTGEDQRSEWKRTANGGSRIEKGNETRGNVQINIRKRGKCAMNRKRPGRSKILAFSRRRKNAGLGVRRRKNAASIIPPDMGHPPSKGASVVMPCMHPESYKREKTESHVEQPRKYNSITRNSCIHKNMKRDATDLDGMERVSRAKHEISIEPVFLPFSTKTIV